jgi:serine/threonine-protein kinase
MRAVWSRLQGVLHPQVPRHGAALEEGDQLWLVRDWQQGRTYRELLEARRERQLVFGAGEVLLMLRQFLPVLTVLHGQDLVHGDLCPANLLRRDSDGLPVPLDLGLMRGEPAPKATPGYAPAEQVRGEPAEPWMDLHALGVVALVLLSGDEPEALLDPVSLAWRWPAALEGEEPLRQQLERLLASEPKRRFGSAAQALAAFQRLEMPESTGPVARADRTVALVPQERPEPPAPAAAAAEAEPAAAEPQPAPAPVAPVVPPEPSLRRRYLEKEEQAEGGFWPVVVALVLSAVAGTALGWWWLGRGKPVEPPPRAEEPAPASLPPGEVNQRQQLLNRLRALQVDRAWFLSLVDASLLAQYPERKGRLPSEALEDAPLRRVWNELAQEWLVRVEQLPMEIRRRLGGFTAADWERRKSGLVGQGLSAGVLQELVSGSARDLLGGRGGREIPDEPFRQLWYAAAEMQLANMRIDAITLRPRVTQVVTADVPAAGARLFPVQVPPGHGLVLGLTGTPLLQMSVFSAAGELLAPRGALRVVTLAPQEESPVQLLVTNDGVAPARITVSLRADPPAPASPPPPSPVPGLQPEPGAAGQPPASESPLPLDRDRGLPRNRGSDAPEPPADGTEGEAEGEPATRP